MIYNIEDLLKREDISPELKGVLRRNAEGIRRKEILLQQLKIMHQDRGLPFLEVGEKVVANLLRDDEVTGKSFYEERHGEVQSYSFGLGIVGMGNIGWMNYRIMGEDGKEFSCWRLRLRKAS